MEELFRKFCRFYLLNGSEEDLENLKKESGTDFDDYQKKALKYIKNLKRKTGKLGFNTDFESFCNLLETYINKKDKLSDEEKKTYLKILMSLSEIHEIDLRSELNRYVSYKKTPKKQKSLEEIFNKFCRYHLDYQDDIATFNELKELTKINKIDFNEMQQKSLSFIEEIKTLTEKLGFDPSLESFYKMVDEYLEQKNNMTDSQKMIYLKILLYLSEIYKINLRELLTPAKSPKKENKEEITLEYIIKNLSNPLDNHELLKKLLIKRYNECYFNIDYPTISEKENESFNYNQLQAKLTYKLLRIFLDKYNNYAIEDLNSRFTNILTEEDVVCLEEIDEDELLNIIEDINNHKNTSYISKNYSLSSNLANFLYLILTESTNLDKEFIDCTNYSLFNLPHEKYTYQLYLSGSKSNLYFILCTFIKKCIEWNLNYDMNITSSANNLYTLIIYCNENDIATKINIIDSLINKNLKNLIEPYPFSARLNNSLYGISHIGILDENGECHLPYQDMILCILEVAYYRVLAKLVSCQIDKEESLKIVNNFISLKNVSFDEENKGNPIFAKYNDNDFSIVKDIINQYIPFVTSTLSIYMEDENHQKELCEEFKKSIMYISNIINNKDRKSASNIAI